MDQAYFVFFGLISAFVITLCISVLIIVNRIYSELYDLKKEFRKFRDGEQYYLQVCMDKERK